MASNKKIRDGYYPQAGTYKKGASGGMESNKININNNDKCPCNSGMKYKKCCKGKTIYLKSKVY
jgi:uncharacterized protein YecA (UPF0149 family)